MLINNPVITGSFTVNGTNFITNTPSTGSNTFNGNQIISGSAIVTGSLQVTGSITTTGTITAQTLNVQQVTSSVVYSSGSNVFGNSQSNIQQMTGSLLITGSSVLVGTTTSNGFKFKLSNNGAEEIAMNPGDSANLNSYVNYNRATSAYIAATYYAATHSFMQGNVGIGTASPSGVFHAQATNSGIYFNLGTAYTPIIKAAGALSDIQIESVGNGGNVYLNAPGTTSIINFQVNGSERMRVNPSGYVGIGSISPASRLYVATAAGAVKAYDDTTKTNIMVFDTTSMEAGVGGSITFGGYKTAQTNGGNFAAIDGVKENGTAGNEGGNFRVWTANSSGVFTERSRVTSGGYTKMSNAATYTNVAGPYHEMWNNASNNEIVVLRNTSASPYGYTLQFSGASPNGGSNWFMYCEDSTAQRFSVRSNGGVYNYTGNNVPLSDQRMKKEITPLESYWNKFKEIEMVKFKYIDQTHDDFNIGVISQQIESIMPEFVDVWDERNIPEDGKPLMGVYMEDIHNIAMKVLQEAMAKIEQLEAEIETLKNK